jgi:hypothetical protein
MFVVRTLVLIKSQIRQPKIENPKFQIQNFKSKIQNPKSKIEYSVFPRVEFASQP